MATPRKHWFKVPDSIADEDWSNDVLATLVRLQGRMNTRWARNGLDADQACSICLTAYDAMAVTRRGSFRRACAVLRECTTAVTSTLQVERAAVKFSWPKWSEFQGLPSRELPESRPRVAPSETQTQTQTQTEEKKKRAQTPAGAVERGDPLPPSVHSDALEPEGPAQAALPGVEPAAEDPLGKHRALLNLLARCEGSPREKELWLLDELDVMLLEADKEPDPPAASKALRALTLRWYKAYLRRPKLELHSRLERKYEQAERREKELAALKAHRARQDADPEVQRQKAWALSLRERGVPIGPLDPFARGEREAEYERANGVH